MHPTDADRIVTSENPDQDVPLGAVWCGSTLSPDLTVRKHRIIMTTFFNASLDQRRSNRKADQRLCFGYADSTIPLLSKSEISSLQTSTVAVQPGLCRTCSETPKTGFLTTRLKWWLGLKIFLPPIFLLLLSQEKQCFQFLGKECSFHMGKLPRNLLVSFMPLQCLRSYRGEILVSRLIEKDWSSWGSSLQG